MNPQAQFCHNPRCWAHGRAGEGHIVIHSPRERRYRCKRCAKTFSATRGTALYRAHKPEAAIVQVVTLLAHGCPPQAIVAAFGWDERTVARYQREAGAQCRRVHERLVQAGRVVLDQVQADELRVRVVGGVVWLAMAVAVTSRLWLGGVVRAQRDGALIRRLLERVRACGPWRALLLCTDGLRSYATQARRVFRDPQRTGRSGRPRLALPAGVMLAQAIKQYARQRVIGMGRRVVLGTAEAVQARLDATQAMAGAVINTAYIERLNATFRARLAVLVRRSRAAARQTATLEAGMWLVGTCYNFCWPHRTLRRWRTAADPPGGHWVECTPAVAAGLTDHRWALRDLLTYRVPPPPVTRRGRRPRWLQEVAHA
jgi:transposase-like protein/IS1 family transposase